MAGTLHSPTAQFSVLGRRGRYWDRWTWKDPVLKIWDIARMKSGRNCFRKRRRLIQLNEEQPENVVAGRISSFACQPVRATAMLDLSICTWISFPTLSFFLNAT